MLFSLSKTHNFIFLSSLYHKKTIKNCQKFLAKGLKDLHIRMNIKQKLRINVARANGLLVLIYSNEGINANTCEVERYYLPKGIIKNYHHQ